MGKPKRTKFNPSRPAGGYFTSLTLSNVRCFGPEQTLKLVDQDGAPARWTVLLGDNGVGKTTLLQALAIVAPALPPGDQDGLEVRELFGRVERVAFHLFEGAWGPGMVRRGHTDCRIFADLHYSSRLGALDGADSSSGITKEEILSPPWPIFCAGYGGTRRIAGGALYTPKDGPFATLFDDQAPLRNAEEWLLLSDYAAAKESIATKKHKADRELARVKAALIEILPDVRDIRVTLTDKPGAAPSVEVQTADGWVALRDLSLGYRSTLSWMVDLASRMFEAHPGSKDPLSEPAVALIDEIDLHLHPRWQRDLLGHLTRRFPQTQFIVTAHSPLVVQAAPDANIAVLRREGDHVVIDQDSASVRGWRVDQILTSDLFGLPSARDPREDDLRRRREAILGKARLTAKDKAELAGIDGKLARAPSGETPQQMEAMDVVLRAAARLKTARGA